jgi:hypothetical protein
VPTKRVANCLAPSQQVTSVGSIVSERSEAEVETWMILEYCDKGSLQVRC